MAVIFHLTNLLLLTLGLLINMFSYLKKQKQEGKPIHLDALAASGVRFTSWYSNSPVCSPSRASLLTDSFRHLQPSPLHRHLDEGNHIIGQPAASEALLEVGNDLGQRTRTVAASHNLARALV